MRPHVAEAWHVELTQAGLREANQKGNAVLHGDREAVAQHGGGPQTPVQLRGEVSLMLLLLDRELEMTEKADTSGIDCVALLDRNALGHIPREFAKGGDHALERTLGTVLREGRL